MKAKYNNLEMIVHGARKLVNLLEKVVFLGGPETGLLITDPAAADVRMTHDVDVHLPLDLIPLTPANRFTELIERRGKRLHMNLAD